MSETNASAATATPEAVTEPVVEQVAAQPVVENTNTEQVETEQVESAEPDYSYVPKKYLKDGKPDLEAMAKGYTSLEKKLGQI